MTASINKLPYRPCAGVMLVNRQGLIFAGQRIDNPGDAWQMPQGGIDAGEDAHDAALRELWEETGVLAELVSIEAETKGWITYDLPVDLVPGLWNGRFRGQKQKWFLMRYLGGDEQVNIATDHAEFSDWRWLSATDLLDKIVPFKQDVYRQVLDAFGELL